MIIDCKNAKLLFRLLLILWASSSTTQSPQSDIIITDFTQSILTDFSGWSFSNGQSGSSMVCGTFPPVFGDIGTFTQVWKTYVCPSPHYSSEISMDILKIDSWDPNDHLDVLIDSVFVKSFLKSDFQNLINGCWENFNNADWGDELKTFTMVVPHSAQFLELKFASYFDEPQFTEAWGVRNIIINFKICDSICNTCTGPGSNQCTSCSFPYFLDSTTCVLDCGIGRYGDETDSTCKSCASGYYFDMVTSQCKVCNLICKECYEAPDRCYKCPANQFLFDSKNVGGIYFNQCLESKYLNTPHPFYGSRGFYLQEGYKDLSSGTAVGLNCLPPCITCSAIQICSSCPPQMILMDISSTTTCIICDTNGFVIKDSYCLKCPSGCSVCRNETYCEQCFSGLFLEYLANTNGFISRCIDCKSNPNEYIDEKFSTTDGLGVCLKQSECAAIINNCNICSNKYKECKVCKESYLIKKFYESGQDYCSICFPDSFLNVNLFTNQKSCEKKSLISGKLSSTNDPQIYRLSFVNEPWENYFTNFSQNFKIEISAVQLNDSECIVEQEGSFGNMFAYNIILNKSTIKGDTLKVTLLNIPIETEITPFTLNAREFSLKLDSYVNCAQNLTYIKELTYINVFEKATSTCEPRSIIYINYKLRKTSNPSKLHIVFNVDIPYYLENNLEKIIKGSLSKARILSELLTANYSLNKKESKLYEVEFHFNQSIMNSPFFTLEMESDDQRVKFTNSRESIPLSSYYLLSEEEKRTMKNAGEAGRSGTQAAETTMSFNNLFTPGSIFALKGMILIQTFQLMRFIDIDYPPNVVELFDSKLSSFSQDFDIDVDRVDGIMDGQYYKYNFSMYVLNNAGSYIFGGLGYFLIGVMGYYIFPVLKIKFKKSKFILKYLNDFENSLRWNLSLTHFLSRYMILVFTVSANWRFPPLNSFMGRLNFIFSIVSSALIFYLPAFIYKKLVQLKRLRMSVVPAKEYGTKLQKNSVGNEEVDKKAEEEDDARLFVIPDKKGKLIIKRNFDTINTKKKLEDFILKTDDRDTEQDQDIRGNTIYLGDENSSISGNSSNETRKPYTFSKDFDPRLKNGGKPNGKIPELEDNIELTSQMNVQVGDLEKEFENNKQELERVEDKYKIIHEDFKNNNWISFNFLLCELLRQILISLLILYLDKYSVEVLILIIFINSVFIILTIWFKPFNSALTFLLNFFTEIFLLITCMGALILAFIQNDLKNTHKPTLQEDLDIYLRIGWIIVYAYITLVYVYLLVEAINYIIMVKTISKKIYKYLQRRVDKKRKKEKKQTKIQSL